MRVAPAATIFCKSASDRTPPDAFTSSPRSRTIRDINDGLALYEKSKNPPPRARDEIDRQVFENLRWRLELGLTRDVIRWKVTNRSPRLQTLALNFRLTFKGKTQDLWVDGEPLAPHQTSKEVSVKLPGAAPSGPRGAPPTCPICTVGPVFGPRGPGGPELETPGEEPGPRGGGWVGRLPPGGAPIGGGPIPGGPIPGGPPAAVTSQGWPAAGLVSKPPGAWRAGQPGRSGAVGS